MIYTVTINPSIDYIVQLPELHLGLVNRMAYDNKLPGGKGINVSRILRELGHDSVAWGFMGGFTGRFITDALEKDGLKTDFTLSQLTRGSMSRSRPKKKQKSMVRVRQ